MGMEVDVKTVGFDISPFESGGELGPEIRGRIMEILAIQVIKIIRQRVYKGITPDGAPFAPYSPAYEKWKSGKGREVGTKGDWLWYSGQMLQSIKPLFYDGDRFLVGFDSGRGDGRSNALIAWVHDQVGVGNKKVKRPFFSLTEEEKTQAWERAIAQAQQEGLI